LTGAIAGSYKMLKTKLDMTSKHSSAEILITGGTGLLGKEVCELFENNRMPYKVSSHRVCALTDGAIFMDMATGDGVREALTDIKVLVHLASDKKKPDNDIKGIRHILDELKYLKQKTHVVYISIVGTDQIPLPYFKQKWQVEQIIMESGQPYTILRATQFHKYVETVLNQSLKWPVGILPKKIPIQPVDVKPVAAALFRLAQEQPANDTIQLGGREVISLGDVAESWLELQHKKKFIINMPLWGSAGKSLLSGALTCRQQVNGTLSWTEWLYKK
jgi:uncharacterized protein YbjT (DUF2867 family)